MLKKSVSASIGILLMLIIFHAFTVCVWAMDTGATIYVDPNSVIEKNYMGVGVEIDPYEAVYNSEQWQMVCSRLDYMKPSFVRCMITAGFFCTGYDANGNPVYDWNGWAMKKLYDILDYCQSRNITVVTGEWKKPNHSYLNITSSNDPRWMRMMADCVDYLINTKGYTCIKYYTYINEPNGDWSINEPGDRWNIWKTGLVQLYNKFSEKGLNNLVKFVGPDTSGDDGWVDSTVNQIPGYIGIYDVHRYATDADILTGNLEKQMRAKRDYITNFDPQGSTKQFFMGEAGLLDGTDITGQTRIRSFEYGVYMADYFIQSIRAGQAGVSAWMLDDSMHFYDTQNWYHANWGFWDSVDAPEDQVIRPWFYPVSLMSKIFPRNAQTIYTEETGMEALRVAAAKIPDGSNYHLSFAIVNNQDSQRSVTIKLPAAGSNTTFKKYVYFNGNRPVDSNGFAVASETIPNADLTQGIQVVLPSRGVVLLTTIEAGNSIPLNSTITKPKSPVNLVANPGFENSDMVPWTSSGHFTLSSEDKIGGQKSIKLTGTGDYCSIQQEISVTPNTDYIWTFYGKCSSAYNNYKVFSPSYQVIADGGQTLGNNTWTLYALHFNSGNNNTVRIVVGDGGGVNYFDDFCVTNNFVSNGSFENTDLSRWYIPSHFSVSTQEKHSGQKSIKLAGTGDYCSIQQEISVTPNTDYTWTFYGKCTSAYNSYKVFSPSYQVIADGGQTLGNNEWTLYTLRFNSGNHRTVKIAIGDGWGTNYFDDFSISEDLIHNAKFENGFLSPWYAAGSHFSVSSKEKHSGTYSLMLSGTGDYCSIQQDISVSPHTDYAWTFYGKCSSAYNNYVVFSPSYELIANGGSTLGNNEWTLYTLYFNSGNNTTIKLAIGDGGGINYFDDFEITKVNRVSIKNEGNPNRIALAMQRAKQGQTITIGAIGGSITEGHLASSWNKNYLSLVCEWWAKKFPQCNVVTVNAGMSATDSIYGVSRVDRDLLAQAPDIAIIEYAVNDGADPIHSEAYESLVRKLLSSGKAPGVLQLFMTGSNFITAQEAEMVIGKNYDLPAVSFRDALQFECINNNVKINSILPDGLHPNDLGHKMAAGLIIQQLEKIYSQLFKTNTQISPIPAPVTANRFADAKIYGITTQELQNTGWVKTNNLFWQVPEGWKTTAVNAKITFEINSSVIHLMTLRRVPVQGVDAGVISVVVDQQPPIFIDTNFQNGWGDYLNNVLLVDDTVKKMHTIEITFTGSGNECTIFGFLGN